MSRVLLIGRHPRPNTEPYLISLVIKNNRKEAHKSGLGRCIVFPDNLSVGAERNLARVYNQYKQPIRVKPYSNTIEM